MRTSLHHEKNFHTGGRTMAAGDIDNDGDYGDGETGDEADDDGDDDDYGDGQR